MELDPKGTTPGELVQRKLNDKLNKSYIFFANEDAWLKDQKVKIVEISEILLESDEARRRIIIAGKS